MALALNNLKKVDMPLKQRNQTQAQGHPRIGMHSQTDTQT